MLTYKSGRGPSAANLNDPEKGTKKETSDCQKPGDGPAKNDCVSDCRDQ